MDNRPFTEESFESIFSQFFGPLTNYVNSNIRDWESSREIVQGTFMKIWENKDRIEINTSVKSYLYSAVRNRMIDHIRSNKKKEEVNDAVGVNLYEENEQQIDSQLVRQEILKSLEKMKPKMRKIFSMSKIEGLTYSEIASYLNISKRAVEDNVSRALRLLKDDLAQNELIFSL